MTSDVNLLIHCAGGEVQQVVSDLLGSCRLSVRICSLPGPLDLPKRYAGTLILTRIEATSPYQQLELYDWITEVHRSARVVSVATQPIDRMVQQGRFLEGLFYRLNVVQVDMRSARSMGHRALYGASCQA